MSRFKVIGYIGLFSWVIVTMASWMTANMAGDVYFQAGEPNLIIKYIEWVLGAIGLYTAYSGLVDEIDKTRRATAPRQH